MGNISLQRQWQTFKQRTGIDSFVPQPKIFIIAEKRSWHLRVQNISQKEIHFPSQCFPKFHSQSISRVCLSFPVKMAKNGQILVPILLVQAPLINLCSNFTKVIADVPYNTGCQFVRYFLFLKITKSKVML